jgi:glucosamine--fructose-6-phosphate aminotransferase (isomerizing)
VEPLAPQVMIEQVERLASDLRSLAPRYDERVREVLDPSWCSDIDRVILTGDGDSYHAACAAEMAMEQIAGLDCEPLSAFRFDAYSAGSLRAAARPLVIATSASGRTDRVVRAIRAARSHGAATIAVTGVAGSPVTQVADHSIVVDLPEPRHSPGIRTYQASLLGLLLMAAQLGQHRNARPETEIDPANAQHTQLLAELVALDDAVAATASAAADPCHRVAATLADAPVMMMVGSGPSYGTALFAAAKLIEGAGVFAAGQDLEEWSHVERHAYPDDMPVIVIAPPGRSHQRALELAVEAHRLGRRVIAVTTHDDTDLTPYADTVLPVHGYTREEFSPLLYHVFSGYLACHLADALGRKPFQSHRA